MADVVTWSEAPNSVIHLAEQLIENYHPWLKSARIAIVMRSEAQKRGERFILGNTTKVPAKMQALLEYDYLIWISEKDWEAFSDGQREALIDHELMHCKIGPNGFAIREHDLQEFSEIVRRHGLWTRDLRVMNEAVEEYQQGSMFSDTEIAVTNSVTGEVVTISGDRLKRLAREML